MSAVIIETAIDINRSPEDVFDYCSDHTHEPDWNPMMKNIERLTDGPTGVGTRYAIKFVKGPPMIMECTHYEPPTAWSLVGESRAMRARGSWWVAPTSAGARLTMRTELELHGLLKVAGPLVRRKQQILFQRDLENIRERLEGSGRPSNSPARTLPPLSILS